MLKKWYAVYIGRVPGVYNVWRECQAKMNRFPRSSHRGFQTRSEAEASYLRFMLAGERNRNQRKNYFVIPFSHHDRSSLVHDHIIV